MSHMSFPPCQAWEPYAARELMRCRQAGPAICVHGRLRGGGVEQGFLSLGTCTEKPLQVQESRPTARPQPPTPSLQPILRDVQHEQKTHPWDCSSPTSAGCACGQGGPRIYFNDRVQTVGLCLSQQVNYRLCESEIK